MSHRAKRLNVSVRNSEPMYLTRQQFVYRLICAGWTPDEARMEAEDLYTEPDEDDEGQL